MSTTATVNPPPAACASPAPVFTIALLAFDDMEALDFAGPFEVFTTASRVFARMAVAHNAAASVGTASTRPLFGVTCVARTLAPVRARAGLRVLPDADFAAPLAADLLLVPGGVVTQAMACPDTLAWVQRMHAASRVTASVCTGAFILAAAGVLTDEPVTTHWEDQADLQRQFPRLRVQSGVRWVEAGGVAAAKAGAAADHNGTARIITSAGISAGMDMSLRLVATMADPHMRALGLSGQALAERTALQMETTWTQQAPILLFDQPSQHQRWRSAPAMTTHPITTPTTGQALPQPPAIRVLFVLLPHSLTLDWAGPAEVLRSANSVLRGMGQPPRFELGFVGPLAGPVTSVGVCLSGVLPLPRLLADAARPSWVVLVGEPGERMPTDTPAAQDALHWLCGLRLVAGQLELVTVCAGAVLAAHAGLLAGREATTHHHHLDELRQADPTCRVLANRVCVTDGPVCSSAGVTTGIDLMLHRVSGVCGPVVAARVAQALVVALRRGPNDPELSPFLSHRNHMQPAVHRVQDAVSQSPQADWTVQRMAEVACTSPRHLARLFAQHAGVAPLAYVQGIRLDVAEAALRSGRNVGQAAALAGFASDLQLRRTWKQAAKPGTPRDVRAAGGG